MLIETKDLAETDEFVIVKFIEKTDGKIKLSFEKGIKDENGDIIEFIPI